MNLKLRNIIETMYDPDQMEDAVIEAVMERFNYDDIAAKIVETITDEEIAEIALDFFLNS